MIILCLICCCWTSTVKHSVSCTLKSKQPLALTVDHASYPHHNIRQFLLTHTHTCQIWFRFPRVIDFSVGSYQHPDKKTSQGKMDKWYKLTKIYENDWFHFGTEKKNTVKLLVFAVIAWYRMMKDIKKHIKHVLPQIWNWQSPYWRWMILECFFGWNVTCQCTAGITTYTTEIRYRSWGTASKDRLGIRI